MEQDAGRVLEVERTLWTGEVVAVRPDRVAAEAPLEIRVGGAPIAVVMRTPGCDEDLVRGFLLSERIARDPDSIAAVRHCSIADHPDAEDNVVQAVLTHAVDVARFRRNLYASSSCGLCGKASIEQAMARAGPVPSMVRVSVEQLYALPGRLEAKQPGFRQTGGVHAAALLGPQLQEIAVREDVGRHNAVDKVLGAGAAGNLRGSVLMVSGRVSFEIVQKAVACGVEVVAAVSAPTSLAIDLAKEAGLTLIAFVRQQRMSVYAGESRVHRG